MAPKKSGKKKEAGTEIQKFESLKDKTAPIKSEKINKMAQMTEKKRIEMVKEAKKGIPAKYAIAIVAVVAVLAGVLIFTMPGYVRPAGGPVKGGDVVQILYTLTLRNGSVFDAANFTFKVGGGQVIQGVDEAVIGMNVGEKKTVVVKPDKAYGYYDENKIYDVPLDVDMNKTDKLTIGQFNETFGAEPEVQKTYRLEGRVWDPMRVSSIQNQTVVLNHEPENGTVFDLKDVTGNIYGTAKVLVSGETIHIHSYPIRGAMVATLIGQGKIADLNETYMRMDFNSPLASETLTFEITLLNSIPY